MACLEFIAYLLILLSENFHNFRAYLLLLLFDAEIKKGGIVHGARNEAVQGRDVNFTRPIGTRG